uniref:Uncharacterized protein n=1 Tax=Arundo donax TaxID=35708 RepID=A0A0A9G298_ARUDO
MKVARLPPQLMHAQALEVINEVAVAQELMDVDAAADQGDGGDDDDAGMDADDGGGDY